MLDFSNSWVDKSLPTISISAVLGMLAEPFDQQAVAEKTYNKRFNDPNSEYYQMTVDQIIAEWGRRGQESCRYGRLSDDYIEHKLTKSEMELELWKLDNNYEYDERLQNNCDSFDNFYALFGPKYEFIDREKDIYVAVELPNGVKYYVRGRLDAIFKNKETGRYLIIDWKTSGTIEKTPNQWTQKLKGPAMNYPALNWYTYTMQTYFYKKGFIDSGYAPEGLTFDDIDVAIVDLPGKILESTGKNWEYATPAFPYDDSFMTKLLTWAVQRTELEKKIKEQNAKN